MGAWLWFDGVLSQVTVEQNDDIDSGKRPSTQRLDMVRWLAAFDAMALAMDAAEVWYE